MSDYNFSLIKDAVINWYNEQLCDQDNVIISKYTEDILIIDFEFNNCLAQLTISKIKNNPFQFVYFEAVDFENENKIYHFYDNENMNSKEVINALDEAYNFCLVYRMYE